MTTSTMSALSTSLILLLSSSLIAPVRSSILLQPAPTLAANNNIDDLDAALLQGWTPKPTTPPTLDQNNRHGSISEGELFARQDGGGGARTCGYLTGSGSAPLTCSKSHSCTYFTQAAFTPGNFGCCQVDSGTAGCAYVSTCLDYTVGGPGPTQAGVYFGVQDERIYW